MSQVRAMLGEAWKRAPLSRVRFLEGATDVQPTAAAAQALPVWNMRITFNDLMEHRFDLGCEQCKYIVRYGRSRAGMSVRRES